MIFEEALEAHLIAHPSLSALIGGRVYPVQLPDKKPLPAQTYQRISSSPVKHRSSRLSNYGRPRFQFDSWGRTYLEALQVRNALREAMADFVQASGPRVDVALLQDERDAFESEPGRWRAISDFYVWHTEI